MSSPHFIFFLHSIFNISLKCISFKKDNLVNGMSLMTVSFESSRCPSF